MKTYDLQDLNGKVDAGFGLSATQAEYVMQELATVRAQRDALAEALRQIEYDAAMGAHIGSHINPHHILEITYAALATLEDE